MQMNGNVLIFFPPKHRSLEQPSQELFKGTLIMKSRVNVLRSYQTLKYNHSTWDAKAGGLQVHC